ncbi:GAP family protein [bacterium]|nr:GAP family protein [bacterium]
MTPAALAGFFGLALVDSLNPSAIAAVILLGSQPGFAGKAAVYVAAVFTTYLCFGVAALLGFSLAWTVLDTTAGHAVLALIGAAMLAYALFAKPPASPADATEIPAGGATATAPQDTLGLLAVAALGVGVTFAELPTALPYAGALALLVDAGVGPAQWIPLLLLYNLIFVAPPTLIAILYLVFGRGANDRFRRFADWLKRQATETVLWLMGIVGFFLLADSGLKVAAAMGWITLGDG